MRMRSVTGWLAPLALALCAVAGAPRLEGGC